MALETIRSQGIRFVNEQNTAFSRVERLRDIFLSVPHKLPDQLATARADNFVSGQQAHSVHDIAHSATKSRFSCSRPVHQANTGMRVILQRGSDKNGMDARCNRKHANT